MAEPSKPRNNRGFGSLKRLVSRLRRRRRRTREKEDVNEVEQSVPVLREDSQISDDPYSVDLDQITSNESVQSDPPGNPDSKDEQILDGGIFPLLLVGALSVSPFESGAEIRTDESLDTGNSPSSKISHLVVGSLTETVAESGAEVSICTNCAINQQPFEQDGATNEEGNTFEEESLVSLLGEQEHYDGDVLTISLKVTRDDDEDDSMHEFTNRCEKSQHDSPVIRIEALTEMEQEEAIIPKGSPVKEHTARGLPHDNHRLDNVSLADSLTSDEASHTSSVEMAEEYPELQTESHLEVGEPESKEVPSNATDLRRISEIVQSDSTDPVSKNDDNTLSPLATYSASIQIMTANEARDDEIHANTQIAEPVADVDKTLPLVREPPSPLREPRSTSRLCVVERSHSETHRVHDSRTNVDQETDDGSLTSSSVDSSMTVSTRGCRFGMGGIGSGCLMNSPPVSESSEGSSEEYTLDSISDSSSTDSLHLGVDHRTRSRDQHIQYASEDEYSQPSIALEETSLEFKTPCVVICIKPYKNRRLKS